MILEGANAGENFARLYAFSDRGNGNSAAACRTSFQGRVQVAGAIIDNHSLHGIQLFAPKRPSASKSLNGGESMDGVFTPSA
jgi:hypothetical protein